MPKPERKYRKYIGSIGVDSGSVMVTDPMYVKGFDSKAKWDSVVSDLNGHQSEAPHESYPYSYGGAAAASCNRDSAGRLGYEGAEGVVAMSGWGDGFYPVYVEYDPETGRPAQLIVKFIHNCDTEGHSYVDENDPELPDSNTQICEHCGKEI